MSIKKAIKLAGMAMVASYAIAGCMWAGAQAGDPNQPPVAQAQPANSAPPDYVLGSDDQLHITVWKEADFTVTLPVRPDGKISLPLINDVKAAGRPPSRFE